MRKEIKMEKKDIVKIVFENIIVIAAMFLGLVAPGVLTIGLFQREMFMKMDIVKLLVLSACLCFPTGSLLILASRSDCHSQQTDVSLALIINAAIFSVTLFVKIWWRGMTLGVFVSAIAALTIIFTLALNHYSKDENKNKNEND